MSGRSLSEISEDERASFAVDLVAAARRFLGFLRLVAASHWLHRKPALLDAVRRYDQLWMPLISDLTTEQRPPMILPPLDVEWIKYKNYCESRFSKPIGKAAIFDEENEDYAVERCREIWESRFPTEPFENKADVDENVCSSSSSSSSSSPSTNIEGSNDCLLQQVLVHRDLCKGFREPYYSEMVYLVAAKQRYKAFIYMVHRFGDESSSLVPTSDILLMWITHKSYPTMYAMDCKNLDNNMEKIIVLRDTVKEEDVEETKMLWDRTFDQPYEKAGGAAVIAQPTVNEPPFYWDTTDIDVNTKYKSLMPRFLFEVCLSIKVTSNIRPGKRDPSREFLRLRTMKCHRELKLDLPLSCFTSKSWQKAWHLYCEFGTKGLIVELRYRGGRFSKGSSLLESVSFSWNDVLRAQTLTLGKEIDGRLRIMVSITPPVQGPYLLKCVSDRATDDSGAMISDVILKMNHYRPQEGRWLSRTVLDHAGRECFVVRMRVGEGFWRRGGEVPRAVNSKDRVIEIREGSWSYVVGSTSIGRSSGNVVGTATPKEAREGFQASWNLSTGHELLIQRDTSKPFPALRFDVVNESTEPSLKLLQGRQLQYGLDEKESNNDDDEFATLVRVSDENPMGKATGVLNWKLLVVEIQPEEDAVTALLLCHSILRSVSEMKREDVGGLLVRRRVKEAKIGDRDWGSVIVHPSSSSFVSSSPYVGRPWYRDANRVMALQEKDGSMGHPQNSWNYSQTEGGEKLYKTLISN
ncbi:glycine-rich domain-containing protein 2 isoform X2 [Andrographis paniculata]|uniref:glycine-rich domain-containing protein 2 isoform X2 n=1 Tax=Andrographis paniculata TaxID=175694 RepID=UPI0021E8783E|nr:glycine-rich domain-containing protein 2 isoform X2 [Andrographis paniculata]